MNKTSKRPNSTVTGVVDLAKDIVKKRDKEHKKYQTIANELGLTECRTIYLAKLWDKAMDK